MVRLLISTLTLVSIFLPPSANGESSVYSSKSALVAHIHSAGFDHVIEVKVDGSKFKNHYSRNGRLYHQSFQSYFNSTDAVRTPELDHIYTAPNGMKFTEHAFKVGESFLCFTKSLNTDHRLFTQKIFNVPETDEIRGFHTCLIIPLEVDVVIEALSSTPLANSESL